MYANVVVLTYQPPSIPTYSYKVSKEQEREIKVGQLVFVPFGKRIPMGIVLSTDYRLPTADYQIKPITSIVFPTPLLLHYQIDLVKWMAFYYHAPMVNCLEAMLPTQALNAKRLMANAKTISQSVNRSSLVSQTLILVPSISRIPETLAIYPHAKNYAVYHSELKPWERISTWQKILLGGIDYIFGSRSAIFAPCQNLKEIIIHDEHDGGYHDERSPYYNTLTIAEKIQKITGARLKIIDSSPKITTYFAFKKDVILDRIEGGNDKRVSSRQVYLERSREARTITSVHAPKVKVISMLDEKAAGNKSPISDLLASYLKLAARRNKTVLLFLNKKVESGHLYCRNCQYSEFAATAPEVCPNCRSPEIWFNSVNVNSLANLVRKIVPRAKVTIIAEGYNQQLATSYQLPAIDIATASVFYKLLPRKYDLVAHIQTDSLLNITDYTSAEKFFAQIISLKKITRGLLLLQTYNPQYPTIISASLGNYQKFFQDQLAQRQALSYPPFSLLVKLTLRGNKEESIEQKSQKLYEELTSRLPDYPTTRLPIILGPYKPQFTGKTAKYNIILKLPVKNYSLGQREVAIKAISPQLSLVLRDWQISKAFLRIEVEPATLND